MGKYKKTKGNTK